MPFKDHEKRKANSRKNTPRWYREQKEERGEQFLKERREKAKKVRREQKAYLVALCGGKCIKCGYSKSLWALQFHHINSDEKEIKNLSKLSFEKQIEEVKKCILVCATCHFEIHEELQLEEEDAI